LTILALWMVIFDNPGIMSGNIWQSWHYEGNLLVIGLVTVEEVKLCIIDLDAGGGAGSLIKSGWTANILPLIMPELSNIATHYARIIKYYHSLCQDCKILQLIMPGLSNITTHYARIVKYYHSLYQDCQILPLIYARIVQILPLIMPGL
jgi:hypothetical protein